MVARGEPYVEVSTEIWPPVRRSRRPRGGPLWRRSQRSRRVAVNVDVYADADHYFCQRVAFQAADAVAHRRPRCCWRCRVRCCSCYSCWCRCRRCRCCRRLLSLRQTCSQLLQLHCAMAANVKPTPATSCCRRPLAASRSRRCRCPRCAPTR